MDAAAAVAVVRTIRARSCVRVDSDSTPQLNFIAGNLRMNVGQSAVIKHHNMPLLGIVCLAHRRVPWINGTPGIMTKVDTWDKEYGEYPLRDKSGMASRPSDLLEL